MRKFLVLGIFLFSSSAFAENEIQDNSITVNNLTDNSKEIWVSGEHYKIEHGSSLRVPCYPGESIYVQSVENTDILSCGEKKEIKQ